MTMSHHHHPNSPGGSNGPSPADALDSFPEIYPYRNLAGGAQSWAQRAAIDDDVVGYGTHAGHLDDASLSNSGWMIPAETMLPRDAYGEDVARAVFANSPSAGGGGGLANPQPLQQQQQQQKQQQHLPPQQQYDHYDEEEVEAEEHEQEVSPASTSARAGPGPSTASSRRASQDGTRSLPMLAQPPPQPRTLDELLVQFWTRQMDLAESGVDEHGDGDAASGEGVSSEEFKTFALPLARIKKVMKSDPDVKMISAEAPVLLSKACEIFIAELTCRAWLVAESFKRRTLQKSDVAAAIGYSDMFDFLIDIVPREEAVSKSELGHRKRNAKSKEKREQEREAKRRRQDGDEGSDRPDAEQEDEQGR